MREKYYHCKNCDFRFSLTFASAEPEIDSIPCPGCAENALEEITEPAGPRMQSRGADCDALCRQCPSYAQCHGTDPEHQ